MACKVDSNFVFTNGAIRPHRQKRATFLAKFWLISIFFIFFFASSGLFSVYISLLYLANVVTGWISIPNSCWIVGSHLILSLPPSIYPFLFLLSRNWLLKVSRANGWGNVKYFVAIVLVALSIHVASSLQPESSGGTGKKTFPIDTHRSICRLQLARNSSPELNFKSYSISITAVAGCCQAKSRREGSQQPARKVVKVSAMDSRAQCHQTLATRLGTWQWLTTRSAC